MLVGRGLISVWSAEKQKANANAEVLLLINDTGFSTVWSAPELNEREFGAHEAL